MAPGTRSENKKEGNGKEKAENTVDKRKTDGEKCTNFNEFQMEMREMFANVNSHITTKFDELDKKFSDMFTGFRAEMVIVKDDIKVVKENLTSVTSTVTSLEESVTFQGETITEMRKKCKEELDKELSLMRERMATLERKFLYLEKHDRKYNLLFYGFEEERGENVYEKLRQSFIDDLGIDEERVHSMYFANGHRFPSEGKGPNPIILKFTSFEDRELVLSRSHRYMKLRKRVHSDLPVVMKRERSRLATEAFKIRQQEGLQTRIREKGLKLTLETRQPGRTGQKWLLREESEI